MSRLVFCEDDAKIRMLITFAMRGTGHDVHVAQDGNEGLALVERVVPHLLITDVAMPGMTGFELADAVRARPHLAQIPIVFMTASVQRSERDEAYRHGALGILSKPFGRAEMLKMVEEALLSGSRAAKEDRRH